ncbi:MAG: hypothetical protein UDB11_00685 [Peptococcaceae bacterium]|nr:hypothetical protein [Peptococcaceae bacterium]
MDIVQIIDDVTAWAQENICNKVQLKLPPDDDKKAVDENYEYALVTPTAFALFTPTKDKLPPKVASPVPSLCVRFVEGEDMLDGSGGSVGVQFMLSTWDLGTHNFDLFYQTDVPTRFIRNDGKAPIFQRNVDGWRDAWNFLDVTRRVLESTTNVAGYEIDVNSGIHFGPLEDQDGTNDFYPLWFCWVNFTLKYPLTRNVRDFTKFL